MSPVYTICGWGGIIAQMPSNIKKVTCCKWGSFQSATKTSSLLSHSGYSMMHGCPTLNANHLHINITKSSIMQLLWCLQMPLRYDHKHYLAIFNDLYPGLLLGTPQGQLAVVVIKAFKVERSLGWYSSIRELHRACTNLILRTWNSSSFIHFHASDNCSTASCSVMCCSAATGPSRVSKKNRDTHSKMWVLKWEVNRGWFSKTFRLLR